MAVEIKPGMEPDVEALTEIVFVIGELTREGCATVAARLVWACRINKHASVTIAFLGYDDDPREIWEIEECSIYLVRLIHFMQVISSSKFVDQIRQRLTPGSVQWRSPTVQ